MDQPEVGSQTYGFRGHKGVRVWPRWEYKRRSGKAMSKRKCKLTAAEKAEKRRRRLEYMTIFVNGKQKRVKRQPTIDGMSVDEFIRRNADPIWMHQNELWELMDQPDGEENSQHPTQATAHPRGRGLTAPEWAHSLKKRRSGDGQE